MADQLEALLTPPGPELLRRLAEVGSTAADELGLAERLRREYPAELVTAALGLHELRRRAAVKFARAETMYFTRDGLEQASAEPLARHRARRYAGAGRVADLCTGIGGDLIGLAGADGITEVLAVDSDPVHLRMAGLNATAYGLAAVVHPLCSDVRAVDLAAVAAVFVDPARRTGPGSGSGGGSRRLPGGLSEPPLAWCVELASRVPVGVKAAPGLDRTVVPVGWETEFVAVGRELREAVLWAPGLAAPGVAGRATVLPAAPAQAAPAQAAPGPAAPGTAAPAHAGTLPVGDELLPEPGGPVACRAPGAYLYDPNPAVTRAGLVEDLARRLGLWKIDPMIAFLSGDRPLVDPFARTLRVLDSAPWREKELAGRLRAVDAGSVDVRRRGLAGDVDVLHRRLRAALGGGSRRVTLVMTRVLGRPWSLICVDN
ncbi:MAG: class I SAM-dependent methyltransferase [Pseudonocardia sp.]